METLLVWFVFTFRAHVSAEQSTIAASPNCQNTTALAVSVSLCVSLQWRPFYISLQVIFLSHIHWNDFTVLAEH